MARGFIGRLHAAIRLLVAVALGLALVALLFLALGGRQGDLPWTPLDLSEPPGGFTRSKLAGLAGDRPQCLALLEAAGVEAEPRPAQGSDQCRATELVAAPPAGARTIAFDPADVAPSCPVVAALALWEWHVVQPAAQRLLGSRVVAYRHLGSYNCRRIGGGGNWSEHATGNAIDIAAFRLADGRSISLSGDWQGDGEEARFLREVRDGACQLFTTVLSPDYNAAHADHFHFDQAARGGWGGACR